MPTSLATTRLAALRTLAVAGASDKLLAQAVRELLVDLDAVSPGWEQGPAVGIEAQPAVTAAEVPREPVSLPPTSNPQSRLPELMPAQQATATPPHAPRPVVAAHVRITVREANGNRSTVAIKGTDWAELLALNPDEGLLQRKAKELALQTPEGCKNRSAWVFERLRSALTGRNGN